MKWYELLRYMRIGIGILLMLFISASSTGCLSFKNHAVGIQDSAKETGGLDYEILGDAEGASSSLRLFWIFPVTPVINYDEAINDAIRKLGGDNLVEVTSWKEKNVYLIGTVDVLHVKGNVIRYLK
jgi:hypothetical protein